MNPWSAELQRKPRAQKGNPAITAIEPYSTLMGLGLSDRLWVSGGRLFAIIVILMAVVLASIEDSLDCFYFCTLFAVLSSCCLGGDRSHVRRFVCDKLMSYCSIPYLVGFSWLKVYRRFRAALRSLM